MASPAAAGPGKGNSISAVLRLLTMTLVLSIMTPPPRPVKGASLSTRGGPFARRAVAEAGNASGSSPPPQPSSKTFLNTWLHGMPGSRADASHMSLERIWSTSDLNRSIRCVT